MKALFFLGMINFWLLVSTTHLKNKSKWGSSTSFGVKIKHIWNHHLALSCGWRAGEVQKGWESECQSAWEVGEGTSNHSRSLATSNAAKGLSYILGCPKKPAQGQTKVIAFNWTSLICWLVHVVWPFRLASHRNPWILFDTFSWNDNWSKTYVSLYSKHCCDEYHSRDEAPHICVTPWCPAKQLASFLSRS